MPPDQVKIERLPKWAQQYIGTLERNLAHAHAKLAVGPEDSDTFLEPYGTPKLRPLGDGVSVRFTLGTKRYGIYVDARTDVSPRAEKRLVLMGGTGLVIKPVSSNIVYVSNDA